MSFQEIRFPDTISSGSTGGPTRLTDVVVLRSGAERRNSVWENSRRKYNAGLGIRSIEEIYSALEFFEIAEGRLNGFRWKDWLDYKSGSPMSDPEFGDQPQQIPTDEFQIFQLQKTYSYGSQKKIRKIQKPVEGTVSVFVNGQEVSGVVDLTSGKFVLSVEATESDSVTAKFEFDIPVRFDQDEFMVDLSLFSAGEVPKLGVIELSFQDIQFMNESMFSILKFFGNYDFVTVSNRVNLAINTEWGLSQ